MTAISIAMLRCIEAKEVAPSLCRHVRDETDILRIVDIVSPVKEFHSR